VTGKKPPWCTCLLKGERAGQSRYSFLYGVIDVRVEVLPDLKLTDENVLAREPPSRLQGASAPPLFSFYGQAINA